MIAGETPSSIILTHSELVAITGYKLPRKQLEELHRRGFIRARLGRVGVILERGHYDAVVSGAAHTEKKNLLKFERVGKLAPLAPYIEPELVCKHSTSKKPPRS
jgi:Domain of unknown function (DUF4224)